ncbi:MAG: hypothetical protein IKJ78_03070 [Bacteroidales bacterium]|nr:hypothetical protein [Bacteroidales bacterium]
MQKNNRLKGLTRLLLLLGFSIASMSAGAQTSVTSLSQITSANGNYRLDADIDASGFEGFSDFTNFRGTLDGGYHTISGLTQPLFTTVDGGTVKNLVLDKVHIASGTNVGAVCGTATGNARIYNCGVQSSDGSSSLAGTTVGGLVGTIAAGSSVRVVNCYNYATVSGTSYSAGIVGRNQGTVSGTTTVDANGVRIAMCMMYGDMTTGTNRSPVYGGNHTNNVQKLTEYNYYRSRANLTYTAYNDQLAIDKDAFLTRFPFYRHILNTHREMAAYFLFGAQPTAEQVAEIGHWVLKPEVAPYPIIEPWETGTHRTTQDIAANLPSITADYAGKLIDSMGNSGYLTVNYNINGTTGSLSLPITDMDTARYDFTWGKVVLPFANELWTQTNYSTVVTGWKITSVTKDGAAYTAFNIPADEPYNFADRDNPQKDIYNATDNPYIFAQGGNYIVPYGVTAISIEANFATAYYLSDARSDFGYNDTYGGQTNLGWAVPNTYHGHTVYTNLSTLVKDHLSNSTNPHSQAIVLVGNYHYNQNTIGGVCFNAGKAVTIMSVDEDRNQEPDYGWYSFHTTDRSPVPPLRFDFVPNIGMGMAGRITGSTRYPTIGIWHGRGWFELTETCVSFMSECEINDGAFTNNDNGQGNNRWIANSGYFIQIVRARSGNANKLSYEQIGGNAYVEELYPGSHTDNQLVTTIRPILVTGGEIEECYMTGYRAGSTATGDNIRFWGAGGKMHKWLGAYMENPSTAGVNVTAKVDHAVIGRFFGGGTSPSARITGNIDITMNNSLVDFYCGGPEFGDMAASKTVTTHATNSTFGEYYGAGFGGTSITYIRHGNNTGVNFGNSIDFPIAFTETYKRLTNNATYGIGSCYKFEFILYSGGGGTGVARSYTGYAKFDLATTGNVTNVLNGCTVLGNYYGAGCQGKVNGTVSSTLTGCTFMGSVFGGGYKAASNEVPVYPSTEPTKSRYTKETGLFSDFGTVEPETFTWQQRGTTGSDDANKILYTTTDMATLGTVTGAISLTLDGGTVAQSVYGTGNESPANGGVTTLVKGGTEVGGDVFGGGNLAQTTGNALLTVENGKATNLFGGGNAAGIDGTATVNMEGGQVRTAIYGGCNSSGAVSGVVNVNVMGGTLGTDADHPINIHGGGYGEATSTGNNVTVNIGQESASAAYPTIWGDVYGGSAKGNVNASTANTTMVNINNAVLHGSVYGGGLGAKTASGDYDAGTYTVSDSIPALVRGNAVVNIGTSTQESNNIQISGSVFGGNNLCGSALGFTTVHIWKTAHTVANTAPVQSGSPEVGTTENLLTLGTDAGNFALQAVYGGGNLAHYNPANALYGGESGKRAFVHVHGCDNTIRHLYGGGNAADTPADSVIIEGGRFFRIFGGGNGERADLPGANVTEGNAYTLVNGGVYNAVFGGSNTKGTIAKDMKLNIVPEGGCGLELIGNLYGGGNLAPSKGGSLTVECGDIVLGNVYGGANAAYVDGDVTLTIKGGSNIDYVFGGSRSVAAENHVGGYAINGNVTLILKGGTIANAFGGSDTKGNIKGDVRVLVDDAEDAGCPLKVDNVYGGGKDAAYVPEEATAATPTVDVVNGTVNNAVFGGGLGAGATVTANPTVNIGGTGANRAVVGGRLIDDSADGKGDVFGGGSEADVLKDGDNTGNTSVTLSGNAEVMGNVYGGGNKAAVEGDTEVNM